MLTDGFLVVKKPDFYSLYTFFFFGLLAAGFVPWFWTLESWKDFAFLLNWTALEIPWHGSIIVFASSAKTNNKWRVLANGILAFDVKMESLCWVLLVGGRDKHIMGSVEEKIKAGGLVIRAQTTLLEEMKLLKEMQDQSGLLWKFSYFVLFLSTAWWVLYIANWWFGFGEVDEKLLLLLFVKSLVFAWVVTKQIKFRS